jgi:serine/tyrosine/threonine adenylyltransferase
MEDFALAHPSLPPKANDALEDFAGRFQFHWLAAMRGKFGLFTVEAGDAALVEELLTWMHKSSADYTHTFRNLRPNADPELSASADGAFTMWHQRWTERLARQPQPLTEVVRLMNANNPAVIPRNHEVEDALAAAVAGDLKPLERVLEAVARPYEEAGQPSGLLKPPLSGTPVCRTFCGT